MPSKHFDPTAPSFYLDNSTMCDAFRAQRSGAKPALLPYRPLLGWIERVALEANLCLSLPHLAELGRWDDAAARQGMSRWYNELPIVWVHSSPKADELEEDHWVQVAAGIAPTPVEMFAPSLFSLFSHLRGKALSDLLAASNPVDALVEAACERRTQGKAPELALPFQMAATVRDNRAWAKQQGWSAQRKRDDLARNKRDYLRRVAVESRERLLARGETLDDVQGQLVELYGRDAKALPMFRIAGLVNVGSFDDVMRRTAGSKKERDSLIGHFYDRLHLVGAAYCDMFTCDRAVSEWLGDVRVQLGRRRQLAVGEHAGGVAGFVAELMAAWP